MTKVPAVVSIWGKKIAAIVWDTSREYAVMEFFPEFENIGLDLAPITMPLKDIKRGERIYYLIMSIVY